MTYEKIFSQIGLTEQEATVYEIMLELGEARAKEIYQKSPFKRGLVYKLLDTLIEKHLIVRIDKPGKVSIFRVEHPDKINDLVEAQERKVRHYKKSIHSLMPELISNYNLAFNKPGIKFYEGLEGIKKILNDTLTSKTAIYTIADKRSVEDSLSELNADFRKKSIRSGIPKKIIIPESDKKLYATDTTHDNIERRFIKGKLPLFKTGIQIYDNKISYQTLDQDKKIAILIEDENIYQMHKILFEYIWNGLDS